MLVFILIIEMIGTVAFSVSGAMVAMRKNMDIFGVMILGTVTAVGGGLLRDIIIGKTPPQCFLSPEYITVSLVTAFLFFIPAVRKRLSKKPKAFDLALFVMDSVGLAIFTVVGIRAANEVSQNFSPVLLVFVGLLTGTGGGVMRDVLAGDTPYVFVKHIYATASIAGALLYIVLDLSGCNEFVTVSLSIVVIFVIRCLSSHFKWNLPKASV